MLFDGAAVVEAAQALTNLDYLDATQASAPDASDAADLPPAVAPQPQRREYVFIDASLPDVQALVDGVAPGAEVHLVQPGEEGWTRMADILAGVQGVDAIHVLGHGATGAATLGTTTLDRASLGEYAATLQRIGDSLADDGDLLLYGCDIGQGEAGQQFITALAQLTRADVAASVDDTGRDGNWTLEAATGTVEASALARPAWDHQLGTPSISGLANSVYTEQEAAKLLAPLFSTSGGQYYDDGYFQVSGTGNASETLALTSSSTPTAAGAISVSGSDVRVGTGTGTMRIGVIDSYYNGTAGRALRVNFAAPLTNGGFENSLSNWTINTNFGGFAGDDHQTTDQTVSFFGTPWTLPRITETAEVSNAQYSEGTSSLQLVINGTVTSAYGTAHGPEVVSAPFSATQGDQIALDWKALDSGDDYDVYGFLYDGATGQSYQLFYSRGDYTDWTKLTATIPVTSNQLQFKFYAGSYDATGGQAVGSTLYIDNVRVISRIVTDSMVAQIGRQVTYHNASDAPPSSRTLTFSAKSSDGAIGSGNMTLNLIAVPDSPVVGLVDKLGGEDTTTSFSAIDFTSVSSDPDGPYTPFAGIRITSLPEHGTLRLSGAVLSANAYIAVGDLGNLTYTPDANWHGTETFSWVGHDGTLDSAVPGTVRIAVASVDDAPVMTASSGAVTSVNGAAVAVDPNLYLYDVDNGEAGKDSFPQFKVYINAPQTGDFLDVASLPSGFSKSWDGATYVLTISGTGTAAQYRDILRSVTYSTSNPSGTRTVSFTSSANVGFGGHYYEKVVVGGSISWTDAYYAAQGRTYLGMQGYLATITSQAEQNFLNSKVSSNTWIGLTDDPAYAPNASEGNFRWIYGSPEAGTSPYGTFTNFDSGEPNDFGSGEDFTHMYATGLWNDFPNSAGVNAYIVEYSGGTPDPSLLTVTRDVAFVGSNAAPTVSALNVSTTEDRTLTFTAGQFTSNYSDADGNALALVRITSLPLYGTLTLDGRNVTNGQDIGAVDLGRLKYTPGANWNGTDSFGWNGFDGKVFAGAGSTVTITVSAVNDAPTLNASASPYVTGFAEDVTDDGGTLVSTLISRGSVADVDGPAAGLAVTAVDNTHGTWQYNIGGGWLDFSATTGQAVNLGSSARLLSGSSLVRFIPNANWNGSATFSIRPWDGSSGSNGGTADPFAVGGNTSIGARAADLDTVSVTVTAVNDAPQAVAATTVMVGNTEDETALNAQTVAGFAAAAIGEADASPLYGVAVTAQDNGSGAGTWEYSVDNGANWLAVGAVDASQALLLRASDLVRFVPNLQNGGAGSLTWRAWDQTDGSTAGARVDLSGVAGGGTSAYATGLVTSSITLSSVNDAPLLTAGAALTHPATDEDNASAARTVAQVLVDAGWSDVDTGTARGIAVTGLTQRHHWQYSTDGVTWVNMTDPTVVGSGPGDTPNAVGSSRALLLSATTQIRYNPDAQRGETASLSFRAWDGSTGTASTNSARSFGDPTATNAAGGTGAFSTQARTVSIAVADVNDAPRLTVADTAGFNVVGATENDTTISAQTVADFAVGGGGITEVDDTTLFGIAVTAQNDGGEGGTWQYSIDGGTTWSDIGNVSGSRALLLRSTDQVRFAPNTLNGGTGSLTWRAWDRTDAGIQGSRVDLSGVTGGGTSAFSSTSVTRTSVLASVNDAPTAGVLPEDGYVLGSQVNQPTADVFDDVDHGDVLTYTATGLPPGITIDTATGVISGVPTRPGNYEVVVTADDSHGGTVSTVWRVRVVAPVREGEASASLGGPAPGDVPVDGGGSRLAPPQAPAGMFDPDGIPGHQTLIPVPESLRASIRSGDAGKADVPVPQEDPAAASARTASPVESDGLRRVAPSAGADAGTPPQAIDRLDVSVGARGQVDLRQRPLNEGEVTAGLMLVEVRQQERVLEVEIADFKARQVREYRATLLDGKPLPEWLRIDPASGAVSGRPPEGVKTIDLRVIANDMDGRTRLLELRLNLDAAAGNGEGPTERGPANPPAPGGQSRSHGMPGFAAQLERAHATRAGRA